MDFLKKNYEKILLGVVLVGLAVAVVSLLFQIPSEKQKLEDARNTLIHPKVKPLTNLDLTLPEATLARVAAPALLDLSTTNKLFNALQWKKAADGHLIKYDDTHIGPRAVTVTRITPLYLILTFDSVVESPSGSRYVIGVENEAAANPANRRKRQAYSNVGVKNDPFIIRDVKGPANEPTQLNLELIDTSQRVVITKEKPFKRIDGYMADLKYDPEKKSWLTRRVNSVISLNGEDYKIVAITQNEVVLSAPNQKKWPVSYTATP